MTTRAYDYIIAKQIEWATNNGLRLQGSQGVRGKKMFTMKVGNNLFLPLSRDTRSEIEAGDGKELVGKNGLPARMQALHSSSAIGVNLFEHWRSQPNIAIPMAACGFSRQKVLSGAIKFEQQYPVFANSKKDPNLDVVITPKRGMTCAIECKFTEPYSSRRHGGLRETYLRDRSIWDNLSATKRLARKITPDDAEFDHLHAAQLIRHILGLNQQIGHGRYRLLYLWYDAFGSEGANHRDEIQKFAAIVKADGVNFLQHTYPVSYTHLTLPTKA